MTYTATEARLDRMSRQDVIETIAANLAEVPFFGDNGWRRFVRTFDAWDYDRLVRLLNVVAFECEKTGKYGPESVTDCATVGIDYRASVSDLQIAPIFRSR